mmetsp:Transcript_33372/g.73190  ORF Transcript_33372/g.73190 Transcript_33372/m.73190 type:complete len:371 (+) Transcript_33372:191-1303(+)
MVKRKISNEHGATSREGLREEYKKAKRAYKDDKSDDGLKSALKDAKRALEEAENSSAGAAAAGKIHGDIAGSSNDDTSSTSTCSEPDVGGDETQDKESKDTVKNEEHRAGDGDQKDPDIANKAKAREDEEEKEEEGHKSDPATSDIKVLEEAYQAALAAFKADKSNKDLRRAKTAARRALDAAVAASTDGEQLTCRDCSRQFIFTKEEMSKYEKRGWTDLPLRCKSCDVSHKARRSASDRRQKLDSSGGKRMCYAFQRGECPHGDRCKFSHDPAHGGKYTEGSIGYRNAMRRHKMCYEFERTGTCKYGDKCVYSHDPSAADERYDRNDGKKFVKKDTAGKKAGAKDGPTTDAKDRKEKSLRKKAKGWRNK